MRYIEKYDRERIVAEKLSGIQPFSSLPKNELHSIAESFHQKKFRPGAFLASKGEDLSRLGLLQSGRAVILSSDSTGRDIECGFIESGQFFGEAAALTDGKSDVNVKCESSVTCFIQNCSDFLKMIEKHVELRDFFYRSALERLKNTLLSSEKAGRGFDAEYGWEMKNPRRPRVIEKALDYIDKKYAEQLTLEDVAEVNGMSKFHFSRIFNEKSGYSFKDYLNRKRIAEAKRLMREEEYNVSEACYSVGFNDVSYFGQVFKKLEQMNPSQYRRRVLEERTVDLWEEE